MAASEKGETCMDDFDVKHHDRELDDLLSEVKGLLGEEPEVLRRRGGLPGRGHLHSADGL